MTPPSQSSNPVFNEVFPSLLARERIPIFVYIKNIWKWKNVLYYDFFADIFFFLGVPPIIFKSFSVKLQLFDIDNSLISNTIHLWENFIL